MLRVIWRYEPEVLGDISSTLDPKALPDVVYLCYPNNPTGAIATKEQLQKWVDWANARQALILFDAAYEAFIRTPGIPRSIYECNGARTCAIEFRSFSKTAGFRHGSRVVTACAIIMISVFGGFTLSGDDFILQMAFALAAAIALDAFVVRMTIVPAVLALLGRRAWWLPRWLDRILPNVDVEGDRLRRELARREPVAAHR